MNRARYPDVAHLVVGPADHGVVRFGLRLAELMGGPLRQVERPELATRELLAPVLDLHPRAVHLQYTDSLYAAHTTAAADAFEELSGRLTGPVTVTLHDLPDPRDDPGRYGRRARSYARVAAAVDAVVVSSDHESRLLTMLTSSAPMRPDGLLGRSDPGRTAGRLPPTVVVPLPVEPPPVLTAAQRPLPRPEVAVFGFVYPGKGHDDVLRAITDLPPDIGFTALGRAADGHQDLIDDLTARAVRSRRRIDVTGFVPDAGLDHRLRQVAVPVAPGRLVSASGSINTWIGAGRRPLVAEGSYTREFDERYPGAVRLYRPRQLPELIEAVLAEPKLSWLPTPVPDFVTGADTARAYGEALTHRPERVR